ncbi:MAG TPA: AAA family ATPase [Candidatus Chromulinivoraceae bacterium]|nr:AAA family ATPase [Candidatus Chromulinivoraceae bacterium]
MRKPRLILLNGFAGSGKTTIGKEYINEHPLTLLIEGDELIVNIGQWLSNELEARSHVFELTKAMTKTHLAVGRDVVLPYLVVDASHVISFEQIATSYGADFYEFLVFNGKDTAIERLMKRGTWGEAGQDPLTEKDKPVIEALYDTMESQLEHRKDAVRIVMDGKTVEAVYDELKGYLKNS